MQLNITGKGIELSEPLKEYVTKKFQDFEKLGRITNTHIIFKTEKNNYFAEATLHFENSEINATGSGVDFYTAVDDLVNKVSTQIIKHKEKLKSHHE